MGNQISKSGLKALQFIVKIFNDAQSGFSQENNFFMNLTLGHCYARQYDYISLHQDLSSLELRGHTTFQRNAPYQFSSTIKHNQNRY